MLIMPAIDLLDGACVRLSGGRFDEATKYGDDPLEEAEKFAAAGAQWVHVVDLDGARDGRPVQHATLRRIARNTRIITENLATAHAWMQERRDFLSWTPPRGGLLALLKYDLPLDSLALADKLALEYSVMLAPGSAFGYPSFTAYYVACDYAPGGNFVGQYPYQAGPTASDCPDGYPAVEDGLCVMPEPGQTAALLAGALALAALSRRRRR